MPLDPPPLDQLLPGYAQAVDELSEALRYYEAHRHRSTDPLWYEARDRLFAARRQLKRVTAILQPDQPPKTAPFTISI